MTRYPAWIDGEQGSYGVSFPDLPGIVAMGTTVDEALLHAEEALRDYVNETERDGEPIAAPTSIEKIETPTGYTLVSVPLIRLSGRSVRASLTLDEGVAAFIDGEARRRKMTRTAYIEWMARRIAQTGG
ncbi:MAG: type II toxin-antitoxin system HicB family antitoxin [Spirochaetaceae bacterium]|nr:type II toxin-antitoxin system HicB family antitoxin [Spirochaetaceae bacterium]